MSIIENSSDLIFKKKYYKYKTKYINEKNKLTGGQILKEGLYAFFTNDFFFTKNSKQALWSDDEKINKTFEYMKDGNAPSISQLSQKLAYGCYSLESNSDKLVLLQSENKTYHDRLNNMPPIISPESKFKVKSKDIDCNLYFPKSKKVNFDNDADIIKLGQLINDLDLNLLFKFIYNKSDGRIDYGNNIKGFIKNNFIIDCCIIIQVNSWRKNNIFVKEIKIDPPTTLKK